MSKVVAKKGLDKDEVIEELACALDMANLLLKEPSALDKQTVLRAIKHAMDMCEESD